MKILNQLKVLATKYLKEKNKEYLIATRNIINALQNKQKDKKNNLTEQEEIQVLKNLRKKSLESIEAYKKGNRQDLVKLEKIDLKIIEQFLPKELSEEKTKEIIEKVIQKLNTKDIGLIMKELKQYKNINMGLASKIIRTLI